MTEVPNIDLNALAKLIAKELLEQSDPDALMDAEDVGARLKRSTRYVLEDYSRTPGFPKAIRLTGPDGRLGHKQWRRKDITEWINKHADHKTTRGGKPRNTPLI